MTQQVRVSAQAYITWQLSRLHKLVVKQCKFMAFIIITVKSCHTRARQCNAVHITEDLTFLREHAKYALHREAQNLFTDQQETLQV